MKKIFGKLTVILFLVSCQGIDRTSKPDNLLSEEKMVDVLTELSLLHGARTYNQSLMEEKGIDPYPYLSEKYGIDSTRLAQSNEYYARNYKQYQRIYDQVKERLEALMAEYDSIRENEQKMRDSLRLVRPKDSLVPRGLKRDTLVPLRMAEDLPPPVYRSRIQR